MAEKRWTENQKNAIEATKGSVLVSAAAGSGKTAVLVERVIRRITSPINPIDIDKLLVVTYTRAAAAEMKERISQKLNELLLKDPFNQHLRRQQLILPNASISTIHSFCSEIVKEHFFDCDVSPNFRLAEETELNLLKQQALEQVLSNAYDSDDPQFLYFTSAFSTAKSEKNLNTIVLSLYTFLCAHPFSEKWMNEKERMYDFNEDVAQTPWGNVLLTYTKDAAEFLTHIAQESITLFSELPELGEKVLDTLQLDLQYAQAFAKAVETGHWDKIRRQLELYSAATFSAPRAFTENPIKKKIHGNHNLIKDVVKKKLQPVFAKSAETCRDEIYTLSPLIHQLFSIVRQFGETYSTLKKEKNWLDFNDLEHFTLSVLVNETDDGFTFTNAAKEIASNFTEVMVDEYQDANEVQDIIFQAVSSGNKNLFVVGDVKQSIYGFRQAMPEIFIRRKESYFLYDTEKKLYPAKIILDKNFRSRAGITDAVNFIFKRLLSKDIGDMEYTDEEQLVAGASYPVSSTPDVSFHLLQAHDDMNIQESRHIAGIIKTLVGKYEITQGDKARTTAYSDCAILLRNANKHAGVIVKELLAQGIPAVSDVSESFLKANEISVMLSFLKVIDNPMQDIPLLTVLMSPIYAFSADEMAEIRLAQPKENLYNALKYCAENENTKAKHFFEQLTLYRAFAVANTADELLQRIFIETGYAQMVSATENGALKVNNLRLLQKYAKAYENSGNSRGLSGFMYYIQRLEENGGDLPSSPSLQDVNAVKVMSIHRSKGLEFPICFVAGLSRQMVKDKDDILLHGELGLGIRKRDTENHLRINTMPRTSINLELERENKSEELRVLYVAMTRAREKLYLIASKEKPVEYLHKIGLTLTSSDKLSPFVVRDSSSMADWVTACAMLHPSAEALRQAADMVIGCAEAGGHLWDVKLVLCNENEETDSADKTQDYEKQQEYKTELTENDLAALKIEQDEFLKNTEKQVPLAQENKAQIIDIEELKRRFAAKYAHKESTHLPVKVSVSQVAHSSAENIILSHPSFLLNEDLTPAQKGTALHNFMQYANYRNALNNPAKELDRLTKNGFISQKEQQVIDLKKVTACLKHPLMQRCIQAEKIYREYRFTVTVSADMLDDTTQANDEEIILQGAVDCAFVEDGELVIIDYKTDRVKELSTLTQRYSKQLQLYRYAMEKTTGLPVKECIIFAITKGEIIHVPFA